MQIEAALFVEVLVVVGLQEDFLHCSDQAVDVTEEIPDGLAHSVKGMCKTSDMDQR